MAKYKIALGLGLALVLVAACERPSAVAKKEESAPSREYVSRDETPRPSERSERREEVRQIDGKPIWSTSRRGTAEENAQRAYDRNGEAFGAKDLDDFVRKAHDFVENPPAGVQRLTRANGDTLLYDPKANIFAVVNRDGAPRTMFKPDEGAAYWEQQKTRVAQQASRGDRRQDSAGDS